MRRFSPLLLICSLVVSTATVGVAATAASASDPSDLPSGFVDGVPVGSGDAPPTTTAGAAPTEGATANGDAKADAAPVTKYFGQGPFEAIQAAAEATPRCAGLSAPGLAALVVSPIFKESSAATRPTSAPSPMTLSRYDEWNGVMATTTNQSANYGLYAFRDPYTAYTRAYWHPGIGIYQYDSAGVGAPYTAIERMNVRTVSEDVAKGMAARYCNPPVNIVGHGAPFTEQERRDAAWWPWWAGTATRNCPLCQIEFDRMTSRTPYFSNISLVQGISATGGAARRSCTIGGQTFECWYINPSVGVIEGATAWATLAPDGNGSPITKPAPLSRPFYVLERNGNEERHWLRADTGYDADISAVRQLGKNARPRSSQSGSGLAWTKSSGLCDVSAKRGACGGSNPSPQPPPPPPPASDPLAPPAGVNATRLAVSGTYRPIALDHNGDGRGDVLWYAPGRAGDVLWTGTGSGGFASRSLVIDGAFDDVAVLDVDGNGRDDLLWYSRSSGLTVLWRSNGDGTFASSRLSPGAGKRPTIGNFDGKGGDEIFWYGPGNGADAIWTWTGNGFRSSPRTVRGNYAVIVGDFDGNGLDDLFWYVPGGSGDSMWLHSTRGGYVTKAVKVGGSYWPLVGDFDGDQRDDIIWYAPGGAPDTAWFGGSGGKFAAQQFKVNTTYQPVVADVGGDGRDDVLWYAPGDTSDLWTRWGADRGRSSVGLSLGGNHRPFVGAFSAGGRDGVLWYAPGPTADVLWWR
jgi:hypothetical protein